MGSMIAQNFLRSQLSQNLGIPLCIGKQTPALPGGTGLGFMGRKSIERWFTDGVACRKEEDLIF
jgi:hypothetical protein